MAADFPFARTMLVLRNERTIKKTGITTQESHYYLSNEMPTEHSESQWIELIRGHWGGVEIRNHWRRDAIMGEDGSRSRNANLLANMALVRSALLVLTGEQLPEHSLPQIHEHLYSSPAQCLALLTV